MSASVAKGCSITRPVNLVNHPHATNLPAADRDKFSDWTGRWSPQVLVGLPGFVFVADDALALSLLGLGRLITSTGSAFDQH